MGQFVHTGTKVPLKTLHSNVSGGLSIQTTMSTETFFQIPHLFEPLLAAKAVHPVAHAAQLLELMVWFAFF